MYTLSASLPCCHRGPVVSMKDLSWPAGVPEPGGRAEEDDVGPGQVIEAGLGDVGGVAEVLAPGRVAVDGLRRRLLGDLPQPDVAPACSAPSTAACAKACTVPVAL